MPSIQIPANLSFRIMSNSGDRRKAYTVTNPGSIADLFVGKDRNVTTSGFFEGIKVLQGGGTLEDEFHKGEVWVISTGTPSVHFVEDLTQPLFRISP